MRFLFFGIMIFCMPTHAENSVSSDLAHCSKIDEQIKFLKAKRSDAAYMMALETLLKDVKLLKKTFQEDKGDYPRNMLRNCYQKKGQAIELVMERASAALKGKVDFLMHVGEYALVRGKFKSAYDSFSMVAERNPAFYLPQWKQLQAWVFWQQAKKVKLSKRAFSREIAPYLKTLLKSDDTPPSYANRLRA